MKNIYKDLIAAGASSDGFKKFIIYFFTHPEFRAVFYMRCSMHHYSRGGWHKVLAKLFWLKIVKYHACYLSPKARIGLSFSLPHATGVVIGDGAVIGNNVTLYQNVTIGQKEEGSYPCIHDNVTIYAGAAIIGAVTIHEGAVIGANAVVTKDIPANCIAAGVPAKVISSPKLNTDYTSSR